MSDTCASQELGAKVTTVAAASTQGQKEHKDVGSLGMLPGKWKEMAVLPCCTKTKRKKKTYFFYSLHSKFSL